MDKSKHVRLNKIEIYANQIKSASDVNHWLKNNCMREKKFVFFLMDEFVVPHCYMNQM